MLPNTRVCQLCACLLFTLGCRAERPSSNEALAALGNYRPYQARLTTALGYAPCVAEPFSEGTSNCDGGLPGVAPLRRWNCSPRPRPQSQAFTILVKAGAEAFARAARDDASESELLKAANVQLLWQGDEQMVERAAAWLRRGLEVASDRQPFLADLGAVHLVLAERSGKTEELLRSIEYSEQALEEQPHAADPRYNLALALSQLGLSGSAQLEWQQFLAHKPPDPWATDARSRLPSVPPVEGEPLKKKIMERLSAAVGGRRYEDLLAAGRENRQLTREWIESDLLPSWAEARLAGDEETAARDIEGARQLASDLATVTGDRLLIESVAAISGASVSQQLQLARGYRGFKEGLEKLYEETEDAHKQFADAERRFRLGRSRFVLWARFNRALALYISQRFPAAEAALALLARDVDTDRYPALAGRIHWIRGLTTSNLGRVEESNAHYRAAATIFCHLGENQNLAATQGLLAAGEHKLGHYEAAWTLTRNALARRESIFQLRRLQAILQDATNNADRQGMPRAGLYFADEFVSVVEREGNAMNRYNALIRRAALHEVLGQASGARADLAAADRVLQSLSSKAQRESADANGALAEARSRPAAISAEIMERLSHAIDYYRKTDNQQKLPQAYGLRAQGYLKQQRLDLAEGDLNKEARLLENTLFATSPGPLRQDRVLVLQDFFDHMVEFQARMQRDAAAAFRFSEQQRHWALWEWARTTAPGAGRSPMLGNPLATVSWSELRATRSADTTILAYHVLPHQVLLWVSGPRGSKMVITEVDREALHSKLATLLAAARRRDMGTLHSLATALYEILIAPVAASISGVSMVVIVPDRVLQELPFGLLRDSSTGRYLYESHALVFSPSATAYERLSRISHRPSEISTRLLAVAATRGEKPTLPLLPEATKEAAAVAAQWQDGRATSFREEAPLRRNLAFADAFHFAGHAIADSNSLRLVFHDDAAQPLQLTAADILGESFPRLRLVSLSGCQTVDVGQASQIGSPSAGFVRSFLAIGVPTVVASFLDLDDRRARDIFPAFYRLLARGQDPARAMRQACIEQPFKDQDEHTLLCGSLAVYGFSASVMGENAGNSPSMRNR